jgi:hypothetical protein
MSKWIRLGTLLGCAALVPRLWAGYAAGSFWRAGDAQVELSRSVAARIDAGVDATHFRTGSERFDGEWAFGTFLMSTLGLGQTVLAHPEERTRLVPAMQRSVEHLIAAETNAFGTAAWGHPGLSDLAHGRGHGYLGYANLALSMLRLVDSTTPHASLNDELTEALADRLEASPHALFETYPGESYPPDVAMVAGSIALHDCATGRPPRAFMPVWRTRFERYIDHGSGLLYQAAQADSGATIGAPRGSGTAIAAYATSFVDPQLSRRLYDGLRRHALSVLGFGVVREYPANQLGAGDIDSGPVLWGVGVSATGFALAAARLHGDRQLYTELYRTVDLFGVPLGDRHGRHFMSGGPLGNAIVLAMTGASFEFARHCRRGGS